MKRPMKQMHETKINALLLEPFYGGSHKRFADGLIRHSRHSLTLRDMPARFWKWRMRGAAIHFAKTPENLAGYDLVIASGLMSTADFKALAGNRCPPVIVYFHENQFSYPLARGERMDYQFGFTDITSALAADRVLFNSQTHMNTFFDAMQQFIRKMPDFRPGWTAGAIRKKAAVCYPGCDITPLTRKTVKQGAPPLIIWNHRWEHDKQPEAFFAAIEAIGSRGIDFNIALLGETFEKYPGVFDAAKKAFGARIVAFGYEPDRKAYMQWLRQGTVVVSTAKQENFGISVVEAAACGCLPLLPDRLSYPEIIPEKFHEICIYRSQGDLVEKLSGLLVHAAAYDKQRRQLATEMVKCYAWENRIEAFDRHMTEIADLTRESKKISATAGPL